MGESHVAKFPFPALLSDTAWKFALEGMRLIPYHLGLSRVNMLSKARGATKRALRRRTGAAALQEPWQASLHSLIPICDCFSGVVQLIKG